MSADAGDWAAYMTLQGGAEANRSTMPLRVYTVESVDTETGEVCQNRYGEWVERVKGVALHEALAVETRLKVWTIQQKPVSPVEQLSEIKPHSDYEVLADVLRTFTPLATDPESLPAGGFSAVPWSTVNNCTGNREARLERAAIQLESMEAA